ncbi:aldehyde dehydrogenase family protein [Shouchella shacheensis]|uniref:aldehyde dehydrogenase family protein n=1 Tax=Shouchella shacheensis TaxID=1649580 RepID=UPI0007402E9B|nr:aldehyde dehydrogenase family protein [Shouchella shacheensis]
MTVQVGVQSYPLFIDGKRQPAAGGETFEVLNPATGELIANVAKAGEADVEKAVQSARDAFDKTDWKGLPPKERAKRLHAIAHEIKVHAQELVYLETVSSGATVRRAAANDLTLMVDLFKTMAKFVLDYPFSETLPSAPFPGPSHNFVWREPIGVCAAITPWNMPMLIATWKIAPALAMGNTIVIKPASYTPLSTLKLAEIISKVVPPGVINVVTGPGKEIGEALVSHPKVDKVAFTGSTEVGKTIMSLASGTIKNTTLELGGKSPNIILEDADLDLAIPGSLFGVFLHSGQLCESGTRLFVPDKLHDEVVKRLVALTKTLKPGNPLDQATDIGPVISKKQKESILSYIKAGKKEGATLVCGGKELTVPGCEEGHFIEPTIFTDVTNEMTIAREEIFGPVLSVIRYSEVDEVVELANDTIYGLAAGIWTQDVNQAYAVARKLRAGVVWINDWHMLRNDAPFGGYKQSGIGREMGKHSLDAYTQVKHVHTSMVPDLHKRSWYQILFSNSEQGEG